MIKSMLKLGIVLSLFASGACLAMAIVYSITGPVIKTQEEQALNDALKEIFPDADSFKDISKEISSSDPKIQILNAYEIKKGDTILGVAVKATGPSYSANAILLTGINTDGTIKQVRVLQLSDTPGLGANAANQGYYVDKARKITFTGQFIGKKTTDPFIVKDDVQTLTAATITSRSLSAIVKGSGEAASQYLSRKGGAR
ncbi:MAG TPA: FMN-binding protein [Spirochaetales bacterium]|nr:FMN-binding protein [Spirochaetales bacterium]